MIGQTITGKLDTIILILVHSIGYVYVFDLFDITSFMLYKVNLDSYTSMKTSEDERLERRDKGN